MWKFSKSAPFEEKSAALRQFEKDVFDAEIHGDHVNEVYKRWAKSYDQVMAGNVTGSNRVLDTD